MGDLIKRKKEREEKGLPHMMELQKQRMIEDAEAAKKEKAQKQWDKLHGSNLHKVLERERTAAKLERAQTLKRLKSSQAMDANHLIDMCMG